jgi:hypothetical protein
VEQNSLVGEIQLNEQLPLLRKVYSSR